MLVREARKLLKNTRFKRGVVICEQTHQSDYYVSFPGCLHNIYAGYEIQGQLDAEFLVRAADIIEKLCDEIEGRFKVHDVAEYYEDDDENI